MKQLLRGVSDGASYLEMLLVVLVGGIVVAVVIPIVH